MTNYFYRCKNCQQSYESYCPDECERCGYKKFEFCLGDVWFGEYKGNKVIGEEERE